MPEQHTTKLEHHALRIKRLKARWPAWVALLVVAILYEALPRIFYWGPRGLMISLVIVLSIPLMITLWRSSVRLNRLVSLCINILITLYMIASIIRLVVAVLQGHIGPEHLLMSALALWSSNVLIFALWYWNLDAGGPYQRESIDGGRIAAFLFPQTQILLTQPRNLPVSIKDWQPHFIDYLFLSFNTSTAFSPTDTPVISRWAKCMGMIQALISLTIIVMLAARAINILNPSANYLVS